MLKNKFNKSIRWVAHVGDEAHFGGGVAKSVNILKNSESILNKTKYRFISLYGINFFTQIKLAIQDLYFNRYQNFLIHSFFNPYSLVLFLSPLKLNIIMMPHGELKRDAMRVKRSKKITLIIIVKIFKYINKKLKKIHIISTNTEELNIASNVFNVHKKHCIPDLISKEMLLNKKHQVCENAEINVIIIARMTKNKGISLFLKSFIKKIEQKNKIGWLDDVTSINIFYIKGNPYELKKVQKLSKYIITNLSINVNLYEGYNHNKISKTISLMPNKLAIIPSHFESFSYVLIEQLNFEYSPIVWFSNELVNELSDRGLCSFTGFGSFLVDKNKPFFLKKNKQDDVEAFIDSYSKKTLSLYKDAIHTAFNL